MAMDNARQQLMPADLEYHPSPGEREIYLKTACTGHQERPAAAMGVCHEPKGGKNGESTTYSH